MLPHFDGRSSLHRLSTFSAADQKTYCSRDQDEVKDDFNKQLQFVHDVPPLCFVGES